MNRDTKYGSSLYSGIALLLSFIFLFPSGLKLKHTLDFHSETKECKFSKIHLHASSSHDDLLDYYFQTLVHNVPDFIAFSSIEVISQAYNHYSFLFSSRTRNGHGLRAPPVVI